MLGNIKGRLGGTSWSARYIRGLLGGRRVLNLLYNQKVPSKLAHTRNNVRRKLPRGKSPASPCSPLKALFYPNWSYSTRRLAIYSKKRSRSSARFSAKPTVSTIICPEHYGRPANTSPERVLPREISHGEFSSRKLSCQILRRSHARNKFLEQAQSGCRHKDKAVEKHESRVAAATGAGASPSKSTTKEEKKEKAKKKVIRDANGNEIKRPLSAYMLYNNHRRPTLRTEHPGK